MTSRIKTMVCSGRALPLPPAHVVAESPEPSMPLPTETWVLRPFPENTLSRYRTRPSALTLLQPPEFVPSPYPFWPTQLMHQTPPPARASLNSPSNAKSSPPPQLFVDVLPEFVTVTFS